MALFGKKKEEKTKADFVSSSDAPKGASRKDPVGAKSQAHVLLRPRITEKATYGTEKGAYVFEIDPRATKFDVIKAMQEFYKVTPRKVNITKIPAKSVATRQRGVFGRKSGGKKAYVYLKEGDVIDIV